MYKSRGAWKFPESSLQTQQTRYLLNTQSVNNSLNLALVSLLRAWCIPGRPSGAGDRQGSTVRLLAIFATSYHYSAAPDLIGHQRLLANPL